MPLKSVEQAEHCPAQSCCSLRPYRTLALPLCCMGLLPISSPVCLEWADRRSITCPSLDQPLPAPECPTLGTRKSCTYEGTHKDLGVALTLQGSLQIAVDAGRALWKRR